MSEQPSEVTAIRSYGCSFGCGNPYDYVFVSVADGTTEFLCLPCFVRLASDLLAAVTEPDSKRVRDAVKDMGNLDVTPMRGSKPRSRGKNAPADTEDPDLIMAFDSVITEDDLPDEFR
jgi:hypothetical protein